METYKAALHKDVSAIFDGVWDPQEENDNIQQTFDLPDLSSLADIQPRPNDESVRQSFEEPAPSRTAFVQPRRLAPDPQPFPRVIRLRQPKVSTIRKFFTFGDIFSSRARRERRRLSAISRHLLINMPSS